jgi:tetratricopeptide (TPR) repeat protein
MQWARNFGMWCTLILSACQCESQEHAQERTHTETLHNYVADGKEALSRKEYDAAIGALKKALAVSPNDVEGLLLLAEAYSQNHNETGAVLALKQAEELKGDDPSIKRARVDLYLTLHQNVAALNEMKKLKALELLTDKEVCAMALLQAHEGLTDEAFATVNSILAHDSDNPEAKITEAEILLTRGDDLLAASLMDRLVAANAHQTSALLLRARYFLANGHPEVSLSDLDNVDSSDLNLPEVLTLRVAALNASSRSDEAISILGRAIDENASDHVALALLAETQLSKGMAAESQVSADKALGINNRSARALLVRGLASEQQNKLSAALVDYEAATKAEPDFAPVYSRLWPLFLGQGRRAEAVGALEKLLHLTALQTAERAQLANLYAESKTNLPLAKSLIAEALKQEPENAAFKSILKKLSGPVAKRNGGGITIMQGGKRRR